MYDFEQSIKAPHWGFFVRRDNVKSNEGNSIDEENRRPLSGLFQWV